MELSAHYINVNGLYTRVWFPWEPLSIVSFQANYLHSQSKPDKSFHMLYVKWKFLLLLIFFLSSLLPNLFQEKNTVFGEIYYYIL